MKKLFLFLFLIPVSLPVKATVRNVPATYTTIQSALNACLSNDTVLVQPGIYFENISWTSVNGIKLLSAGDSSNTVIDGNHTGSVITFSSAAIDTNTVIRGFTITNGWNSYGGGLYISDSSPLFDQVAVTHNHIGATYWSYGAGVYCSSSSVVLINSTISYNQTDSSQWGYGGGVYLGGSGYPVFRNVRVENNTVQSSSWNYGTGIYCENANPVFENVTIKGNQAGDSANWCYGNGIYLENDTAILTNVIVSGNIAGKSASYYYGTGIYFNGCLAVLTNVLVSQNMQADGGNFYKGAGIYVNNTGGEAVSLTNVTVADNERTNNGSIDGSGLNANQGSIVNIKNSIFWNNNPGTEFSANGASVSVSYSDIRGGYTGTGNIQTNPAFVSNSDFHLQSASPCINTGTLAGAPVFDLENNPRPMPALSNPDMGCYEMNQSVGIYDLQFTNYDFEIYPNPAREEITVSGLQVFGFTVKIKIVDAIGREVYSEVLTNDIHSYQTVNRKLKTVNLNPGIYFVEIENGNSKSVKKFIRE